ncbi:SDR family NAD(P)-dependent oxidoreductase [Novosphingobium sp. Leaf2]|uniref:SDR family NAD(P)-dependent oxidoreductase n=1 Tax=Novosphingobium sp. Leaf2 TaxID=1735670 RepID=UPI0009E9443C|nr:SDR family oxidoreductase [Novosphingobium sp. Leaf2]
MRRLQGRVAIVTGGASGIGSATVQRLAQEGAQVVSTDLAAQRHGASGAALCLVHDVRDEAQWITVVEATLQRFGRLDILVNNAGITGAQPIEEVTLEHWNTMLAVNLTGTMLGCKHGVLAMRDNPGGPSGSIINISSMAGFIGMAQTPAYNATKGGVRLLTKSVAVRCASAYRGIRCNSLHPGAIDTPIHERRLSASPDREAARSAMDALQPVGRMGTADEMAACIAFLASDDASFVTGTELVADGGWLADGGSTRLPPTVVQNDSAI